MEELRDLYQTVILDHNKAPRNFGNLPDANREADGHNPICGDRLTVYLHVVEDDRIRMTRNEALYRLGVPPGPAERSSQQLAASL